MTLTSQLGDVLAAALSTRGQTLDAFHIAAVHDRPGAECSIIADVESSGTVVTLVASTVDLPEEDRAALGAVRLDAPGMSVHVWPYPLDPKLPGLATVAHLDEVQRVLARYEPGAVVESSTVTVYRPLRRAVAHVIGRRNDAPAQWFIKVTRPERAAPLLHRMEILREISPPAYGIEHGLVVSEPAGGRPLHHVLGEQCRAGLRLLATPQWLGELLDRIPVSVTGLPERPSWTQRRDQYRAAAASRGLSRDTVDEAMDLIDAAIDAHEAGPVVATHGDFHAANVFVSGPDAAPGDAVLIDVDSVGPGRRVDDVACFVGHLAVSASLAPAHFALVGTTLEQWVAQMETMPGLGSVRARAGAVVMSLAATTAPDPLAEQWLTVARDMARGEPLMNVLT